MARIDIRFASGTDECGAWLYLPETAGAAGSTERSGAPPVVVLGHGFGALRQYRLDAFAERFAAAGYACLVFDYRCFGASGGEPRQLIDIDRQLEDWAAALACVRAFRELCDHPGAAVLAEASADVDAVRRAARRGVALEDVKLPPVRVLRDLG